ncbi:phosphoribosylanthranilate isomerase [Marinilabiliaceae bacterium ANBcel2]|nr:phosphoribosylanthranilate isomerase [Marinilabiliaceae bacterium ANBcel2]
MRCPSNIALLAQLDIDYMGFIFYKNSARYIGDDYINGFNVRELNLSQVTKTGVFVNVKIEEVKEFANKFSLNALQFHGEESADYCKVFKQMGFEVIKALRPQKESLNSVASRYEKVCNYILFDTPTAFYGGSGRKFDWSVLNRYDADTPFFLSGGIELDDVMQIKKIQNKSFAGVDINSRFETEPGLKDFNRVKQFVEQIKKK